MTPGPDHGRAKAKVRDDDYSSEWITSVQPTIQERTGRGSSVAWAFLVNLTAAANFLLARDPGPIHFLRAVISSLGSPWFCSDAGYTGGLPAANHRAAASALSSGRVLKAIAAPGAAL